ncbi:hypothetical protein [Aneurinibacillus uraniidurans]|uniref:hypothetical protein n=1 Tax=Aneurinibacillus uraniidurans TaxID=2966586 RepID=UPI00234B801A|nr:hypothetical protein [Aneurinibacillus sp. B1]WCN37962.1 hypothetical protein PO771_00550 [Aneurinibacillus sp. B1]
MFCPSCGNATSEHANYCARDGYMLGKVDSFSSLSREAGEFCRSCGIARNPLHIYCSACGHSNLKENGKVGSTPTVRSSSAIPALQTSLFRTSMFRLGAGNALVSLLISFILTFFLALIMNSEVKDGIIHYLNIPEYLVDTDVSFLHVMNSVLLVHLASLTLDIDMGLRASGSMNLHLGMFILLLIPFIGLTLSAYLFTKKRDWLVPERLKWSVYTGLLYGILLAFISLLSSSTQEISIPFGGSMEVRSHFSFISTFFNGFFFGTLFSFFGTLAANGKGKFALTSQLRDVIPFGEAVHQAIATVFRGLALSILFISIVLASKDALPDNPIPGTNALIVSQAGGYTWNFLNLSTFYGKIKRDELTISIFSGVKTSDGSDSFDEDLYSYILIGLIIPLFLFFWAGRRIKLTTSTNVLHTLLVFSSVYAGCMMIFSWVTTISVSLTGQAAELGRNSMEMSLGFSLFITFLTTFLFSFAVAYLGQIFTDRHIQPHE